MQTSLFRKNAVLIDDDEAQNLLFKDILTAYGFDVYEEYSALNGLNKIRKILPEVTIINLQIANEEFLTKFINKIRADINNTVMSIVGLSLLKLEISENLQNKFQALSICPLSIEHFANLVIQTLPDQQNAI